ncbi:glycosyltransferase [Roseococcus thiosulfatophilus]|uniref:glycosyltransferase n=1 Tax=Roseococcus thiosulfatophilus TaxID=35813 RepID=UPI001A8F3086|nr:glycosyltransferase [Roseococcus thiosulfatophilus]
MADSPRILFVSVFHPELVRGGAQQTAYELFLGARKAGLDAIFLASCEPNIAPALFKPGAIVTGFDGRPNEYLFLSDSFEHGWYRNVNIRALTWFAEFLRDMKPDVVHFHHFMTIGLDMFLLARRVLPDAKLVLTLHEFLAICKADGHMVRRNDRTLCQKASPVRCHQCFPDISPEMFQLREDWVRHAMSVFDAFIAPTDFVRRRYLSWGLPDEKLHVVTNAQADYSHQDFRVPFLRQTQSHVPNRFGFFGQLVDNKGLGVVFDALELYAKTYTDPITLDISGANLNYASEKFRERFNSFLAEAKSLEPLIKITYHGSYSMADLPTRMSRIDWVIVPSVWWEIFALVLSEAYMFRRPPVVSNIGGVGERVRHDIDGLLFDVGDATSLMQTFHRCVTEEGLHARLAAASPGVPPVLDVVEAHCAVYGVPMPGAEPVEEPSAPSAAPAAPRAKRKAAAPAS